MGNTAFRTFVPLMYFPLQASPNPDGLVPNEGSTSEVVNGHGGWGPRASPLSIRCTTHLEDTPGILHSKSGSEAHGRLHLTDTSPSRRRGRG
eukprot:1195541-Prorocentrum_minimum.AAC.8